ncbi:MAG: GYDIA family GHMP kinase [Psychroserpens sp.]|uniref:GYDIA family GHMP kinase n=1 Tax=Psychroserpens sp. TaxID=2020870 RepID=UPI003C81E622
MKSFHSNGKLLLTGEYVVLDGAIALAVPTVYGQSLTIKKGKTGILKWKSLDEHDLVWFEAKFQLKQNNRDEQTSIARSSIASKSDSISERLLHILLVAKQLNPNFLSGLQGYDVTTKLEFPKNWGLGTSSTLISNIARWANVDAYQLLNLTFGGSGYDIACANEDTSLTFQLSILNSKTPTINKVGFDPSFKNQLYFVHLNQKQNSREGIAQYRENTEDLTSSISIVSAITQNMITCETLQEFQKLMEDHELLISEIIKQQPVKQRLFSDFNGAIKSLGAWGGDFVMVASAENPKIYFKDKGYDTILRYDAMVKI